MASFYDQTTSGRPAPSSGATSSGQPVASSDVNPSGCAGLLLGRGHLRQTGLLLRRDQLLSTTLLMWSDQLGQTACSSRRTAAGVEGEFYCIFVTIPRSMFTRCPCRSLPFSPILQQQALQGEVFWRLLAMVFVVAVAVALS